MLFEKVADFYKDVRFPLIRLAEQIAGGKMSAADAGAEVRGFLENKIRSDIKLLERKMTELNTFKRSFRESYKNRIEICHKERLWWLSSIDSIAKEAVKYVNDKVRELSISGRTNEDEQKMNMNLTREKYRTLEHRTRVETMKLRGNTQFFFPANKKEQEAASARFDPRTR